MSEIDLDKIQAILDAELGLKVTEEQPDESIEEELNVFSDEEYTPPDWVEHKDFPGVMTRKVDAGWLFGLRELAGLEVQTYEGFEKVCPIPVPECPNPYVPNIDQLKALCVSAETGLKSIHVGHTGSGKTSGIEFFAAVTGRPFHRQECDEFTDDQKLFGSLELKEGDTYFNKSDLTRSLEYPAILCMDEVNALPSISQMACNPLFDRRQVRVTSHVDDRTETITAHPEWMITSTSNTNGSSDDMDLYNTANVQDQAMINRQDLFVNVPYPSESAERKILSELVPDMPVAEIKRLAKFSQLMHRAYESRQVSTAFSVRNLIAITKMLPLYDNIQQVLDINFVKRVAECDTQDVKETIRSIWGE